jgi:hypothetical protein
MTQKQIFETLHNAGMERNTGEVKDCLIGLTLVTNRDSACGSSNYEIGEYEQIVTFVYEYFCKY